MKISQKRQLDRFKRSLDFIENHSQDFAAGSEALNTQQQLKELVERVESSLGETSTNKPGRRSYRSDKLTALNALRTELSRIARTAVLVANKDESFKNTFKMPDKRRKNELAQAAHHFIEEFPKVSDKFEQFEMNAGSIEKLQNALSDYEKVQETPATKPARTARTGTSSNPLINQGIELVDALDVMMGNKYNGQEQTMKAWEEASALEVTRRRRKNKTAEANQ